MPAFDPNVLKEELKSEEGQRRDELYTKLNALYTKLNALSGDNRALADEVHALRAKIETAPPGAHAHAAPGRFVS